MKTTLLIVDDDSSVRKSIRKVLRADNYEVLTAADAEEALARFDPKYVQLLLLDVSLPHRNGWDTLQRMTARNPELPIIVITGTGIPSPLPATVRVCALLEKPLDAPALLRTIGSVLAAAQPEQREPSAETVDPDASARALSHSSGTRPSPLSR